VSTAWRAAASLGGGGHLDGREREQLHHAPPPGPNRGLPPARKGALLPGRCRQRGGQGRRGAEQARRGDAFRGAGGDHGDGHGGFGRGRGGRPQPGADGEEGADGALAPADVLDVARGLARGERAGRGRGGARRRRRGVEGDRGAARAHELHRPERVHHRRLRSGAREASVIRNPNGQTIEGSRLKMMAVDRRCVPSAPGGAWRTRACR
jgi:hypothetical protein